MFEGFLLLPVIHSDVHINVQTHFNIKKIKETVNILNFL